MKIQIPKKWWYIGGAVILVLIVGFIFAGSSKKTNLVTASVSTQDVAQLVSVTGRVRSASDVKLAFDRAGRVTRIAADVGTQVVPGQLLISLENDDVTAELNQASANYRAAAAKLDELSRGATEESIQVARVRAASAQSALENARRSAVNSIQTSYTTFDDAVRNKADQFFSNPSSSVPQVTLQIDPVLKTKIENARFTAQSSFQNWDTSTLSPNSSNIEIQAALVIAKKNISVARDLLNMVALAVNDLRLTSNYSQTTIDGYKESVSAARTALNTATTNLSTAEQEIISTQSALDLAKSELAQTIAPTRLENLAAQQASVDAAAANVESVRAKLNKTYLRSPIYGVVTNKMVDVGEIVTANSPVITVISTDKYKIEAFIPESDVATVKIGDLASLTLDAYANQNFAAKVVAIEPGETVVEGVSTYKTTLYFASSTDERVKSGMTANVDIITGKANSVLVIPARAVVERGGKHYVTLVGKDGVSVGDEVEVVTGLRDVSGMIEIRSGLTNGQKVVVSGAKK